LYPAGFYDLRDAAPVPVVSTAFRPKDADELGRNPFRVFTPMLTTDDNKFLGIDLRPRVQWFLAERELFDRALIAEARRMAADGGATPGRAERFVDAAVAAFTLRDEPIEKAWYDELAIVGGSRRHRRGAVHAHQPLDTPGSRHRRGPAADQCARSDDDRRALGSAAVGRA
jgi:uncharacterized glyoxalase superfamily metalloenzyme YdcJ